MPDPPAPDAFKAFEHEGWESVARPYREAFSSLTVQSIEPLLDAGGAGVGCEGYAVRC